VDGTGSHALNAAALLLGKLAGRGGALAVQILIARALGSELFGLYALGWTIMLLAQTFGHLGLGDGVVRFLPRYLGGEPARVKALLFGALGTTIFTGLSIGALAFGFAETVAQGVFGKPAFGQVLVAFVPALIVAPSLHVAAAATRARLVMRHSVLLLDVALPLSIFLACLGLWLLGYSVVGLVAGTSAAFLFVTMLAFVAVWRVFRRELASPERSAVPLAEVLRFSLPTLSLSGISVAMSSCDRLFIGVYGTASDLGLYHAAVQLTMPVAVIYSALAWAVAPRAAAASWQQRSEALQQAYGSMCRWGLYASFPVMLLLFGFSGQILGLVYGHEFEVAANAMRILLGGQIILMLGGMPGFVLVMLGHERRWLMWSIAAVIVNVALNALLVPAYGMVGAALATSLTFSALHLAGLWTLRRLYHIWPLGEPTAAAACGAGLAALALSFTLGHLLPWSPSKISSVVASASIIVFVGLIVKFRVHHSDLEIAESFIRYFRNLS
jgi:O-antigen/teichoic acid export membrane protein